MSSDARDDGGGVRDDDLPEGALRLYSHCEGVGGMFSDCNEGYEGTRVGIWLPLAAHAAREARVAALEAERLDLFDRYVDAAAQGCSYTERNGDVMYCDMATSSYEELFNYLGLTESKVTSAVFSAAIEAKRAALSPRSAKGAT